MINKPANKKYLVIFLFALSFLLYAKTTNYSFVWDDERIHLTNNEQFVKGDIKSFWTEPYSGMYIPVSYTTWTIIKGVTSSKKELSPRVFHVLNILTHSINCVLVFLLLLMLFKQQGNAFWGALLFLLHPLQVESVAWISEFRGLYSTLFSLIALLVLFKFLDKNKIVTVRALLFSKNFLIATVLFALAILSKPSAVVLPFVTGVLAWCFYKANFKAILISLLLWLLMTIPVLIITRQAQPNELLYASVTLWQRVLIAGDTLFFYFRKLVLPFPLVACYGTTPEMVLNNSFIYLGTAAYAVTAVFLFIKRKQYPLFFGGFSIITLCILPVSGLVPFEYQKHATVADRYMYFAMLGAALWIPSFTALATKQSWLKYAGALMFIVYLVLNINQSATWKNEFTVWDHTLKYYQNSPKIYYNRGVEYSKMHRFNEAINDYTQSLILEPGYLDALFNRANAYENVNNLNAAYADYNTYITLDAKDGSVYYKRAYLNYRMGNINEAIDDVKRAEYFGFPVGVKFKKMLSEKYRVEG